MARTGHLLALALLAVTAAGAEPAAKIPQSSAKYELEDFSWVKRQLVKTPKFAGGKVRWCIWILGEGNKSVMTLAWDASGGTGAGYDTIYADKNFNGDLTEDGEKYFWANGQKIGEKYLIAGIKEAGGEKLFYLNFESYSGDSDVIAYASSFGAKWDGGGFETNCLPGNKVIAWSEDLKTAPVYRLGGRALPLLNGKQPGEHLGTMTAGVKCEFWMSVIVPGDSWEHVTLFHHSRVPVYGGPAQTFLRVQDPDGAVREDIPFTSGCV